MKKNKGYNLIKYSLVLLFVAILSVPGTKATLYEDEEKISKNSFTAQFLDVELSSEEDEFKPSDSLVPGNSTSNSYKVSNSGSLPFYYGLKIDSDGNNSDSCKDMQIKVEYESEIIYDDSIGDFDILFDGSEDLLNHMELDPSGDHSYDVEIYIPIYASDELADESCMFDLVAYAWQKQYQPYEGFYDDERDEFEIKTDNWTDPKECKIGNVFTIGDKEDEKSDNPVNELNWPGTFGSFPDYDSPFSVGLSSDSNFPWNSNYKTDYARNVEVDFFYPSNATIAKLTISWSPGRSGDEQKEVFLDGESIGKTNKLTGTRVNGWWEDMERFEDDFIFELTPGAHTLKFTQLEGDGTLWDYIQLEIIECEGRILEEAASISLFEVGMSSVEEPLPEREEEVAQEEKEKNKELEDHEEESGEKEEENVEVEDEGEPEEEQSGEEQPEEEQPEEEQPEEEQSEPPVVVEEEEETEDTEESEDNLQVEEETEGGSDVV